ncbi:MAG: GDSL-type esterase/lipase family protein [Dehalococcoidia bacterium]
MRRMGWRVGLAWIILLIAGVLLPPVAAEFDRSGRSDSALLQGVTGTPANQRFAPFTSRNARQGDTPVPPDPSRTPTITPLVSPTPTRTVPPSGTSTATPTASPTPTSTVPSGGALRFVAVGDSLTEGIGDSQGIGYPGRLLSQVLTSRPGSTMLNLGRSGWTSTELINGQNAEPSQLDAAVAAQPHIVLVWIGSNDLWQLYDLGDPTNADEDTDLTRFSTNIDTILTRLKAAGAKLAIVLADDQTKRPGATTASLPGVSAEEWTRMSAQVVRYNNAVRQRATQHGAVLVDFSSSTIFTTPDLMDPDGIHPNDAGYDAVTQVWRVAIQPLLG